MQVLVVEDEPLIAMEVASILESAGFQVLGPAASVAQARSFLTEADVGVLDINLGRETSEAIALELRQQGKPFVMLTALRDGQSVGSWATHSVAWLMKPLRGSILIAELRKIQEQLTSGGHRD